MRKFIITTISMLFFCIITSTCLVTGEKEKYVVNQDLILFKEKISQILPEKWSVTRFHQNYLKGREGLYITAENPYIKLNLPKGIDHPYLHLYFRPKQVTTKCLQIQLDGSIYSNYLGSTKKYDVYGGSTNSNFIKKIKSSLNLQYTK